MGIVYQRDKRVGITYAYESKSYWDKEKKQSRAKRTLIGRVDDETGEIVPTDGRMKKAQGRKKTPEYVALYEKLSERIDELEKRVDTLSQEQ